MLLGVCFWFWCLFWPAGSAWPSDRWSQWQRDQGSPHQKPLFQAHQWNDVTAPTAGQQMCGLPLRGQGQISSPH